ncbi:expressed unknown protein [Seminavis robusta]|uniref:Uncharacterized protein n=1 Tax=Seminavis robusta TaxID=568900 RepID=A0A9N8HTI6_9STRA|nr:expressed unknown protein [Seminavis robusta]|eukprot:Sro1667_g289810.1 n/a (349) ;mRNA; r:12539-13585
MVDPTMDKDSRPDDSNKRDPSTIECDSFLFWSRSLRETLQDQHHHSQPQTDRAFVDKVTSCQINNSSSSIASSGFSMGDHVYLWCDVAVLQKVYQHHGIVIGVRRRRPDEEEALGDWILRIADFSLMDEEEETSGSFEQLTQLCASTSNNSTADGGSAGGFKVYDSPASKWLKVQYIQEEEDTPETSHPPSVEEEHDNNPQQQQQDKHCHHHRPPVVMRTHTPLCPPQLVRARVEFLLQRPELLPSYLLHESNCECVAVWCKTGQYQTSQIEYWLQGTVENGAWAVGGAQLAALTALSSVPFLVPAVVTYGAVTAGASAVALWKAKHHWHQTTETLNRAFAQHVAAYQ